VAFMPKTPVKKESGSYMKLLSIACLFVNMIIKQDQRRTKTIVTGELS